MKTNETDGAKVRLNDGGFEVEFKPGQWGQFACVAHTRWVYPDVEKNNQALRAAAEGLPEKIVQAVNSYEALLAVAEAAEGLLVRAAKLDQSATRDGLMNCEAIARAHNALANLDKLTKDSVDKIMSTE